jgi:hypothetical protein
MLLEKNVIAGVIYCKYASTNILASEYYLNEDLIITFKGGGRYKYLDVKKTDYTRFEIAESQGAVVNTHIKPYSFIKLEKIDATLLTEEIEALKTKEKEDILRAKIIKLMDTMDAVDTEAKRTLYLTPSKLEDLKINIDDYLTEIK